MGGQPIWDWGGGWGSTAVESGRAYAGLCSLKAGICETEVVEEPKNHTNGSEHALGHGNVVGLESHWPWKGREGEARPVSSLLHSPAWHLAGSGEEQVTGYMHACIHHILIYQWLVWTRLALAFISLGSRPVSHCVLTCLSSFWCCPRCQL